jgi:hypothetical protein
MRYRIVAEHADCHLRRLIALEFYEYATAVAKLMKRYGIRDIKEDLESHHGIINEASELFLENVDIEGWSPTGTQLTILAERLDGYELFISEFGVPNPTCQIFNAMPRAQGRWSKLLGDVCCKVCLRPVHLGKSWGEQHG